MRSRIFSGGIVLFGLVSAAFAQTQLMVDGSFTSGSFAPWQPSGTGVVFNNGYVSMGNVSGAAQSVYQMITFPTDLIQATLSFEYSTISSDTTGSDTLTVYITDTNQPPNFLATFGQLSNANPTPAGTAAVFRANLVTYTGQSVISSYAGKSVNVYFYASTDPISGGLTSFDLTDVSMVVGTIANIPANDNFANATVIPPPGITNAVLTTYASKETGEPNHAGNGGGHSVWYTWTAPSSIGVVTANTVGSAFTTLLGIYTGSTVGGLTPVASADGINNAVSQAALSFATVPGTRYYIALDGYNGQAGTAVLNFRFSQDKTAPRVSFTSPGAGATVTNSTLTVRGAASDNVAVAAVEYRLENANGTNAYQLATGTNSWSATVTNLIPGPNTVRVLSIDTSSNVSVAAARVFNYVIRIPITLVTNGNGRITGATNQQVLNLGYKYDLTATAGKGWIFSNWTDNAGTVITNGRALKFAMESNLVFAANFVLNPFPPGAGSYRGLFYNTNEVAPASSGFFTAQVNANGGFTARLQQGNRNYPMTGQFSLTGGFTTTLKNWNNTTLTLQLNLEGGDTLTGSLANTNWTAMLMSDRDVYSRTNPASEARRYTVVFPGANSASLPAGNGFGAAVVNSLGAITFSGTLGDGTKVTQSTTLSKEGQWPFYASLYNGGGAILGWMTFTNEADRDIDGALTWFKPKQASPRYPAGFTNELDAMGSAYSFTKNVPVLNLTNSVAIFESGDLPMGITNQFTLASDNLVTGGDRLSLRIATASGLFQGSTTNQNGRIISFSGAALQKQSEGFGQFLGTNQSGSVLLESQSP